MKLKLDEDLGQRGAESLRQAGHDVETVASQAMFSANDRSPIETCRDEGRALVTLDLDFANPLVFDPEQFAGIIVLRVTRPISRDAGPGLHVAGRPNGNTSRRGAGCGSSSRAVCVSTGRARNESPRGPRPLPRPNPDLPARLHPLNYGAPPIA